MKRNIWPYLLALIITPFGFFNCKKNEQPVLDCSAVLCAAMTHNFEFTLTDKNTGENVLSDSTPRYTANDIQLLTDPAGGGLAIPFITDTVNNIVSLKAIINNTLYLRIKNTDEYKLSMKIKQVNCCSQQVSKLFIDGRLVCLSCNGVINVPVK